MEKPNLATAIAAIAKDMQETVGYERFGTSYVLVESFDMLYDELRKRLTKKEVYKIYKQIIKRKINVFPGRCDNKKHTD